MTPAAGGEIAARFSDYFRRQISWIEDAVAALDAVLVSDTEPDFERWIAEDAARARRLAELVAEHDALKKEWDAAAGVSSTERAALDQLKARVGTLRQEFDAKREQVSGRLLQAAHALRGEAGELRRGRENARRYGAGEDPGATMVDRRA